ncbi:MAG TPA: hypothetical protein VKN99_20050 [Polyangia bacterium]|nr:hypothetical protein [Polyangia bacterium]
MQRRTVQVLGATLALICASAVAGLAQRLARERQRERTEYDLELVRLRQEATRPPVGERPPAEPPSARTRTVCVGGVDTFVLAAYRATPAPLVRAGLLDGARLKLLSDQAVRAERFTEQAHEPPALARRMGCARTEPGPDGRERCVAALDPPRVACGGQAFAAFELPVAPTPLAHPPARRLTVPAPAKAPAVRRSSRGWPR